MNNVDVEAGETMTDGLVSGNGAVLALKVETTPHDVTVEFIDILDAARDQRGFAGLRTFLDHIEVIRWSSRLVLTAAPELQHREAPRDRDADAALLAINAGLFEACSPAVARGGAGRRGSR